MLVNDASLVRPSLAMGTRNGGQGRGGWGQRGRRLGVSPVGRGRTDPSTVATCSPVLEEFQHVAEASAVGRSPGSHDDIGALRADVQAALSAAGPAIKRRLQRLHDPLRREVDQATQWLKDPAAARTPAVTAGAALRLLSAPEAVADAWDDVVDAFASDCSTQLRRVGSRS